MLPVQAEPSPVFVGPNIDWFSLSPMLVLLGGALAILLLGALFPGRWFRGAHALMTAVVAGAAGTMAIVLWHKISDGPKGLVGGALTLDGFGTFLTILICASVLLTVLFTDDYVRREGLEGVENFVLRLLAAIGAIIMVMANDLLVLFVGLEILSITLYAMAASHLRRSSSQESAVKYFVLGGFASAFLLYGLALIYGATGSTNFTVIARFLSTTVVFDNGLLMAGFALMLVGLGFKVAAAPFQQWTPDVYEGAPSPVTGFMASVAKAAAFGGLIRVFVVVFSSRVADWRPAVLVMTILTLIVGSFVAIVQTDVKRMLAYSSISHAGFILLGVHAASASGVSGSLVYLAAYAIMVLGSFGVVTLVGRTGDGNHSLASYRGLAKERPVLAFVFAIFLLAQAGTPLTSGFIAKLGVLRAAVDNNSYGLAVLAMACAAVSIFMYLRIVVAMFLSDPESGDEAREKIRVPLSAGVGLVAALAFTIVAGVLPSWLVDLADKAIPALGF